MANNILREMVVKVGLKGDKKAKNDLKGFRKLIKGMVGDIKVFKANLSAMATAKAFSLIGDGLRSLTRETKQLFIESSNLAAVQEDSENRLRSALETAGDFNQQDFSGLKKYASALQKVSTTGDETILSGMALIKSFGATNDQIKLVTEASLNYASAQGKSFEEAVRQVSKTLGGYAGELGEMSVEIKNLTAEELKAGKAAEVLNEIYGGIAQRNIKSFSGQVKQLGNIIGDSFEQIGGPLNKAILPFVARLKNDLDALAPTFRMLGVRLAGAFNVVARLFGELGGRNFLKNIIDNIGMLIEDLALIFEDIVMFFSDKESALARSLGVKAGNIGEAIGKGLAIAIPQATIAGIKMMGPMLGGFASELLLPQKARDKASDVSNGLSDFTTGNFDFMETLRDTLRLFKAVHPMYRHIPDVKNYYNINQENSINTPQTASALNNELSNAFSSFSAAPTD